MPVLRKSSLLHFFTPNVIRFLEHVFSVVVAIVFVVVIVVTMLTGDCEDSLANEVVAARVWFSS